MQVFTSESHNTVIILNKWLKIRWSSKKSLLREIFLIQSAQVHRDRQE